MAATQVDDLPRKIAPSAVTHCILCGKGPMVKRNKVIACSQSRCTFRLTLDVDGTSNVEPLLQKYAAKMKYCLYCGEELERNDEVLLCFSENGCLEKFLIREQDKLESEKEDQRTKELKIIPPTEVHYCVSCEKKELRKVRNAIACPGKHCKFRMISDDDMRVELLKYFNAMQYCFSCGRSLQSKTENEAVCSCGMTFYDSKSDSAEANTAVTYENKQKVTEEYSVPVAADKTTEHQQIERSPPLHGVMLQNQRPELSTDAVNITPAVSHPLDEDYVLVSDSVTPDDVPLMVALLEDIRPRELGTCLGVNVKDIEENQQIHLEKVLNIWVEKGMPQWKVLYAALENLNRKDIIEEIKKVMSDTNVVLPPLKQYCFLQSPDEDMLSNRHLPYGTLMFSKYHKDRGDRLMKFLPKRSSRTKTYEIPLKDCMKVIFHCLIPRNIWEWNKESSMYVRFSPLFLGKWKVDCGEFMHIRSLSVEDESILEMKGVVFIPAKELPSIEGIPYKYVVYTKKVFSGELGCWEKLRGSGELNRYLVIPHKKRTAGAIYNVYDLIISPEVSGAWQVAKWLWSKYQGIEYQTKTRSIALMAYLKTHEEKLLDLNAESPLDILQYNMEVSDVLSSLSYTYYCSGTRYEVDLSHTNNSCYLPALLDWVYTRAEQLEKTTCSSHSSKLKRFSAVIVLLYILGHPDHNIFKIQYDVGTVNAVAYLLLPLTRCSITKDKSGKSVCEEFKLLQSMIKGQRDQEIVRNTLSSLCANLVKEHPGDTTWLIAVTLFDYLQGRIDVNLQTHSNGSDVRKSLLQQTTFDLIDTKVVADTFSSCASMFELDPQVLHLCVQVTPTDCFNWVVKNYYQAWDITVGELYKRKEAVKYLRHTFIREVLVVILSRDVKDISTYYKCDVFPERFSDLTHESIVYLRQGAKEIFEQLQQCQTTKAEDQLLTIQLLINLWLTCTAYLTRISTEDNSSIEIEKFKSLLKYWLESKIGSAFFGKSHKKSNIERSESQIWNSLLKIECPSERITKFWKQMLLNLVSERIHELSIDEKLQLFQDQSPHEDLKTKFTESLLDAIRRGQLMKKKKRLELLFQTSSKPKHGEVLGELLLKQYPDGKLDWNSLLSWDLWPSYLMLLKDIKVPTKQELTVMVPKAEKKWEKISDLLGIKEKTMTCACGLEQWLQGLVPGSKTWLYLNNKCEEADAIDAANFARDKVRGLGNLPNLPESASLLCEEAFGLFAHLCFKITKNQVTLSDQACLQEWMEALLTDLKNKEENFKCNLKEEVTKSLMPLHDSCRSRKGYKDVLLPIDVIVESLLNRFMEYKEYVMQRQKILNLKNHCFELAQGDSARLAAMINTESKSSQLLSALCEMSSDSNLYVFPLFQLETEVEEVLSPFSIMMEEKRTKLFSTLWKQHAMEVKEQKERNDEDHEITLTYIVRTIWKPCFDECESVLQKLSDLTLPLGKVRLYFSTFDSKSEIKTEISMITEAVNSCLCLQGRPKIPSPTPETVQKIQLYNQINNYHNAKEALSKLRRTLGLVVAVVDSPQTSDEINDEMSLGSIDKSTVETELKILQDIADEPKRIRCLESFCQCYDLIEWIREVTENREQLPNLVQILQSSGEGSMINDLIAGLSTVGIAFDSLIYEEIPVDATNDVLAERCCILWETLDENPSLTKTLVSCSKQLPVFKQLMETTGDLQKSAINQMRLFNNFGTYEISDGSELLCSSEAAIKLHIDEGEGQGSRLVKFGELLELNNKLVLVSGSQAENGEFLNLLEIVQRLSQLLFQQHQAGNVAYLGFRYRFKCRKALKNKESLIDAEDKMRQDLRNWQREVDQSRREYYWLNYYTTKQLVYLLKKLRDFKRKTKPCDGMQKLLCLLQSVCPVCSSDDVFQCLDKLHKKKESSNLMGTNGESKSALSTVLPTLSAKVLKGRQKEYYDKAFADFKCEKLVLDGLKTLEDTADYMSLEMWCVENEQKYSKFIDDSSHISLESGTENPDISDKHPTVQRLVEEDNYSVEQSIQLVKRHGPDIFNIRKETLSSIDDDDEPNFNNAKGSNTDLLYLSLEELGEFLKDISTASSRVLYQRRRKIKKMIIKEGCPNLIFADPGTLWKTVLNLYMADKDLPLPTFEEVMICSENTSLEEITLIWHRAVNDPDHQRLFCIVSFEKLSYGIADKALHRLEKITQNSRDYRLAFVCCGDARRPHIMAHLAPYVREVRSLPSDDKFTEYLRKSFMDNSPNHAASLDDDKLFCQLLVSSRSGMGKSAFANGLSTRFGEDREISYICIPVHGPHASINCVVKHLVEKSLIQSKSCIQILHFDIAQSVLQEIDPIIFSVAVLGGLQDRAGNVWRRQNSHLLLIECTIMGLEAVDIDKQVCTSWNVSQCDGKLSEVLPLLSIFPAKHFVSPMKVLCLYEKQPPYKGNEIVMMDTNELKSEHFQRSFQYIRRMNAKQDLDKFCFNAMTTEPHAKDALQCILRMLKEHNPDPTWWELHNFIKFLSIQLKDCETSIFCSKEIVGDTLPHIKHFVMELALQMSQEFTAPSLRVVMKYDAVTKKPQEVNYDFKEQHSWMKQSHPYLFFNQPDHHSMTFVGLNITSEGDLIDSKTKSLIKSHVISKQLFTGLLNQQVNFNENYDNWTINEMVGKLGGVLGVSHITNPDPSYVLTIDNLMKMLAIHMRFRCGIPVIMMGETGCGKTRLLRYLCELQSKIYDNARTMICLKVHGGTSPDRVVSAVTKARRIANENDAKYNTIIEGRKMERVHTVLFFDEANTTEAIDMIKEVMCDRRINGEEINGNLKFAAACNPYRKHTPQMLKKLKNAGLGFCDPVKGDLGEYSLVYRVLELPPTMQPFVYDFGSLSGTSEEVYIRKIIGNHVANIRHLPEDIDSGFENCIFGVFKWCQQYMREKEDECSFVSLRDVVRAMIIFEWFLIKLTLDEFKILLRKKAEVEENKRYMSDSELKKTKKENLTGIQRLSISVQPLHDVTKAIIYSVAVCYRSRLSDRRQFDKGVVGQFKSPCKIDDRNPFKRFQLEIQWCQEVFVESMKDHVPQNIALNSALIENIFMMLVAVENRIPLFLVGKPGSSKSLAKSIITNAMRGKRSTSKLLCNFKQIQIFPYQCSQFTTADSIQDIFEQAKCFQEEMDSSKVVSVVVLEEVGLAEASPGFPLKTLHPYLEDGTAGLKLDEEEVARDKRVAFIGISNWALDPAKMNRGIMVTRIPPDDDELIISAKGIASSLNKHYSHILQSLETLFKPLSQMYIKICSKQSALENDSNNPLQQQDQSENLNVKRDFFGLRDYYSVIKMLCWMCLHAKKAPTWMQLQHALYRNFGGHEILNPLDFLEDAEDIKSSCRIPESHEVEPDCTPLGLINAALVSLAPPALKKCSDKPHSMEMQVSLPDSDYLDLVNAYRENRYLLFVTENNSALRILQAHLLSGETPYIVYGSSFPRDQEYTQLCRNINQIKLHMEAGKPVVLLNLEGIYESLYDLLNQYYTQLYKGRYVDLGLRTHRMKCRVHENFKLIIIAEKTKVSNFPIALINRMEKHFILSYTILVNDQLKIANDLKIWATKFATLNTGRIQQNFPFLNTRAFKRLKPEDCFIGFQEDTIASVVLHSSEVLKSMEFEKVFQHCKKLLVQIAPQDAITRLSVTKLEQFEDYETIYFDEQEHISVLLLLRAQVTDCTEKKVSKRLQITTFGQLLNHSDRRRICKDMSYRESSIHLCSLQEFDTEANFCTRIRGFLKKNHGEEKLLIIQTSNGHLNKDLIACARYRALAELKESDDVVHLLFIVQLPRASGGTSFPSFQGNHWICSHIDDLNGCKSTIFQLRQAFKFNLGHFLQHLPFKLKESTPFHAINMLQKCVHKATIDLASSSFKDRAENVVDILVNLIFQFCEGVAPFVKAIFKRIHVIAAEVYNDADWALKEALNVGEHTLVDALCRKVEQCLSRILSFIIVSVDCCSNLDLLKNDDPGIRELWYAIFENPQVVELRFTEEFKRDPEKMGLLYSRHYVAHFPFSWEVISQIEVVLNNNPASDEEFLSSIQNLPISDILNSQDIPDLYSRYLHDFVHHLQLKPKMNDMFEVVSIAIDDVVRHLFPDPKLTSLQRIGAIHLVYRRMEKEILWFTQLVKCFPKCLETFKVKREVSNMVTKESAKVSSLPADKQQYDFVKLVTVTHEDVIPTSTTFVFLLHWRVIEYILNMLKPSKTNLCSMKDRQKWAREVQKCKSAVESVLTCTTVAESTLACTTESEETKQPPPRKVWQAIQATYLLIRHVFMNSSEDLQVFDMIPLRYYNMWTSISFSNKEIVVMLRRQLKTISTLFKKAKEIPELKCTAHEKPIRLVDALQFPCPELHIVCIKCYHDACKREPKCPKCNMAGDYVDDTPRLPPSLQKKFENYRVVQQGCRDFFMEFISVLCFDNSTVEPMDIHHSFVEELMTLAFESGEKAENYSEFLPFEEDRSSRSTPIIRSFLLQLIINFSSKRNQQAADGLEVSPVHRYLQEYFTKIAEDSDHQHVRMDMSLYLICVKSIEDNLFQKYGTHSTVSSACKFTMKTVDESLVILAHQQEVMKHMQTMDFLYLESIAKLRFCLSISASILAEFYWERNDSNYKELQSEDKLCLKQLTRKVYDVHNHIAITTDIRHFLIKQIVREYGFSCLEDLNEHDLLKSWLIPTSKKFREDGTKYRDADPFLLYSEPYSSIQKQLFSERTVTDVFSEEEVQKNLHLWPLLLYTKISIDQPSSLQGNRKITTVFTRMRQWYQEHLSKRASIFNGKKLLTNIEQPVLSSWDSTWDKYLSDIVIHAVAVFSQDSVSNIVLPLCIPLCDAGKLKVLYLPTMADDIIEDIASIGTLWRCAKGHAYFIGNCGRPVGWSGGTISCPEPGCGAIIGGSNMHVAIQGNTKSSAKSSETGYTLDSPENRKLLLSTERQLSAEAFFIIRLLFHASLFWAVTSPDETKQSSICAAISNIATKHEKNLGDFFWHQMEKDIETIAKATKRQEPADVALLVHLVLQSMMTSSSNQGDYSLQSKESRNQWEEDFSDTFVLPITQHISENIGRATQQLLCDTNENQRELFNIINETGTDSSSSIETHLWTYRPRISPSLILIEVRQEEHRKYPLLQTFLEEEHLLRALKYFPDIVKLQYLLYETGNCRLSRNHAEKIGIETFVRDHLPSHLRCQTESIMEAIDSFEKAWMILKDNLPANLPKEYRCISLCRTSPVVYFIPSDTGKGVCSQLLNNYLGRLQNDLIEFSWSLSDKLGTSDREYQLPMSQIQECHMINHGQQLEHVILSHCSYSLFSGHGTEVFYDYPALEKHILDRFILGKPRIQVQVRQMWYTEDVFRTQRFSQVRRNIQQIPLSHQEKQEILASFMKEDVTKTKEELKRATELLNVCLGFMAFTKFSQNALLTRYMKELKLDIHLPARVDRHCTMTHAISLWKTLCVQLATYSTLDKQDPFPDVGLVFKEDLTDDEQRKLDGNLSYYNIDELLETLYEYIVTDLQNRKEEDGHHGLELVEGFLYAAKDYKLDKIEMFEERFPDEITLAKVVAVWKYAVRFKEKKKKQSDV